MGKLVLGILAVVALQIGFSIYFAMDRVPDEISVAAPGAAAQKHPVQNGNSYLDIEPHSEPSDSKTLEPSAGLTVTANPELPEARVRSNRSSAYFADVRTRRVVRNNYVRLAKSSYRVHNRTAESVRREYFGGMLVETSFRPSAARGIQLAKGKNRRLVFGKMTVEYKYAV